MNAFYVLKSIICIRNVHRFFCSSFHCFRDLHHPNVVQFFGLAQLGTDDIGIVIEICDIDLDAFATRRANTRQSASSEHKEVSKGVSFQP